MSENKGESTQIIAFVGQDKELLYPHHFDIMNVLKIANNFKD